MKESCRGGKAESFGANFIGPLKTAITRAYIVLRVKEFT